MQANFTAISFHHPGRLKNGLPFKSHALAAVTVIFLCACSSTHAPNNLITPQTTGSSSKAVEDAVSAALSASKAAESAASAADKAATAAGNAAESSSKLDLKITDDIKPISASANQAKLDAKEAKQLAEKANKDIAAMQNVTQPDKCKGRKPRIHSLGLGSTLVFKRPVNNADNVSVQIPIEGRDLDQGCVNLNITLTGNVQLHQNVGDSYYEVTRPSPDSPDQAIVVLKRKLLDNLETGDRLTLQVAVSEKNVPDDKPERRVVTYADRTFTMYELAEYRIKVKQSQIDPRDITAFPLPDEEAQSLFGPVVKEFYYVVRLSVSNISNEAKLINTGLIRAEGRAIVEPVGVDQPAYTVPITVVPQSLQHVYSIIEDTEDGELRARSFRNLEFIGALGTAVNAIATTAIRATQNMGIFTGVLIPEAKRLFPDHVQNYKKNLVDYAMPELFKVSPNSQAGHKYLFFAKKDIDAVISDHLMYLNSENPNEKIVAKIKKRENSFFSHLNPVTPPPTAPEVRVISLAFDNLDVRFEKVGNITLDTARADLLKLIVNLPKYIEELDGEIRKKKGNEPKVPLANSKFSDLKTKLGYLHKDSAEKNKLLALVTEMGKINDVALNTPKTTFYKDLRDNPAFGLNQLKELKTLIDNIASSATKGEDANVYSKQIDMAKEAIQSSKQSLDFYRQAATTLANVQSDINTLIQMLPTAPKGAADEDEDKALGEIRATLAKQLYQLSTARTGEPITSLMVGEHTIEWDKIGKEPLH